MQNTVFIQRIVTIVDDYHLYKYLTTYAQLAFMLSQQTLL